MDLQSELQEWKKEAEKICKKYNILPPKIIEWNKRLKTTAGRYHTGLQRIQLSLEYRKQYGWKRSNGTFLHELAHHIVSTKCKQRGHNIWWKTICTELGGTMNTQLAGHTFADNATVDYLRTKDKYLYICPCGAKYKRKRKIKMSLACSKCGTSCRNFKVERLTND